LINPNDNPVEWAMLGYELDDVREHITSLLAGLDAKTGIDEGDFRIQIFHVMTHLNRIYNSRNHIGKIDDDLFSEFSKFPSDFSAIG